MRAASTIFAPGPGPTMTMRNYFRGGGRGGGGGGGGGGNGGGARGGGSGGARAAAAASAETVQNDEDEEDDWSTPVSDDVQACADEPVWSPCAAVSIVKTCASDTNGKWSHSASRRAAHSGGPHALGLSAIRLAPFSNTKKKTGPSLLGESRSEFGTHSL